MENADPGAGFQYKLTLKRLHDPSGDKEYWKTRSPAERLEALAILRRQYFESRQQPEPEFQRVFLIHRFGFGSMAISEMDLLSD